MASAAKLPRGVVALGVVSLLMDTFSEMIHSALPVFLTSVLGASVLAVGLIEGVTEATASMTKVFAGAASDALGRRKPFAWAGYALAALAKPLFALAPGVGAVLLARFADRIGKGIRGAPRVAAYPLGRRSDRGRRPVARLGVAALVASLGVLALATSPAAALAGAALYGLHMAATQGLLTTLVADGAPADLRGTALGLFHLVVGVVQLCAGVAAGLAWDQLGPRVVFAAGAACALGALLGLARRRVSAA
jgi:hypothetical protein